MEGQKLDEQRQRINEQRKQLKAKKLDLMEQKQKLESRLESVEQQLHETSEDIRELDGQYKSFQWFHRQIQNGEAENGEEVPLKDVETDDSDESGDSDPEGRGIQEETELNGEQK